MQERCKVSKLFLRNAKERDVYRIYATSPGKFLSLQDLLFSKFPRKRNPVLYKVLEFPFSVAPFG